MYFNQIQKNIFSEESIVDLRNIPQDSSVICGEVNKKYQSNINNFDDYVCEYFKIWQHIITDFNPRLPSASKIGDYEENFAKHHLDWYESLIDNANMSEFSLNAQKFIVTTNTDLRALPTNKPSYHNPLDAGEGYPFDNIQENLLRIGEPLLVFCYSKDQKFAFVLSNAKSSGFVPVNHIAKLSDDFASVLIQSDYVMIINDDSMISHQNNYLTSLDIGTLLPIINNQVMLPVRNIQGELNLIEVKISNDDILKKPLDFNLTNVRLMVDKLIAKPYGWGGYLAHRDCAQLVKDYFAVFGKLMPIFSEEQSKIGQVIDLSGYNKEQKLAKIKLLPIYRTILYEKGHVVIYMGEYQNQPIIFHARWGIPLYDQSSKQYRYIIGKSVITSLEFGRELTGFDLKYSSFLEKISSASYHLEFI
jgi:hypothetical protein